MTQIANTPQPPYYAVIFTSVRTEGDDGYDQMTDRMMELASSQPGFLGLESARNGIGITVSYWSDTESIRAWKTDLEHQEAQKSGHRKWYSAYKVRITRVEREYGM